MSHTTILNPDEGTASALPQIGARLAVLDPKGVFAARDYDPYAALIELVDEDGITHVIRLTRDAGEALLRQLDEALARPELPE